MVSDDWTVVSNEYEDEAQDKTNLVNEFADTIAVFKNDEETFEIEKPKAFWFTESYKISPYLFAIVAGPYMYVEKEGSQPPMRVYARDSMIEWLRKRADEQFLVTQCGIEFYEKFFGQPYPFRKYD